MVNFDTMEVSDFEVSDSRNTIIRFILRVQKLVGVIMIQRMIFHQNSRFKNSISINSDVKTSKSWNQNLLNSFLINFKKLNFKYNSVLFSAERAKSRRIYGKQDNLYARLDFLWRTNIRDRWSRKRYMMECCIWWGEKSIQDGCVQWTW